MVHTRRVLFASWPEGMPDLDKDFAMDEVDLPELEEGQVLIKVLYLSVDPYMRGRMRDVKSYAPPFAIGQPLYGGGVGEVVESRSPSYAVGAIVSGFLLWQDYVVWSPSSGELFTLPAAFGLSYSTALGVLGMPGMTAYFGLLRITEPKPGETVVVTGAAGAVGSLVGQIAKIKGCRVIGIAGSDDKVAYITNELGFDVGINYKTTTDITKAIADAAPNGVDIHFDNVGGDISDAVLANMNRFGRVSCCGAISTYNSTSVPVGPRDEWSLITKSIKKQGFIVTQWQSERQEFFEQMGSWVRSGQIKFTETVREGLENTPKAFVEILQGENTGKMIVKIAK